MRIEKEGNWFVIVKGDNPESGFCFFVDDDGSSWSSRFPDTWSRFNTLKAAKECLASLRRRTALKRQRRQARKQQDALGRYHGCHACGEERRPRLVAGKPTCPECGSENIVCIEKG